MSESNINTKDDKKLYSQLRGGGRLDLTQAVPLARPMAIYLETTNICNFKCIFCPESFGDYKERAGGLFQLSPPDFQYIAEQIKLIGGLKTLSFYMMGEPFVNKNLTNYIKLAKELKISERLIVTTNGTLITEDKYQAICESGLDYLRVSIYGPNEEKHKINTQSPIKLARVVQNILGFKKFRDENGFSLPHIYIKMIESTNPQDNQDFLSTFKDVGDETSLEPVMNWNDPDEGNLAQIDTQSLQAMPYFALKKEACPFPFYTLVIHSDMKVSVCCVDWEKKTVIGDLRKNTLEEIWRGEALFNFQLKHIQRKRSELEGCKNCTYLHTAPDNIDSLKEQDFISRRE
jgi:radical SAM protein with 4Fe4S-binding SPASM domain